MRIYANFLGVDEGRSRELLAACYGPNAVSNARLIVLAVNERPALIAERDALAEKVASLEAVKGELVQGLLGLLMHCGHDGQCNFCQLPLLGHKPNCPAQVAKKILWKAAPLLAPIDMRLAIAAAERNDNPATQSTTPKI